jgi:large subunit ribosomal protein L6
MSRLGKTPIAIPKGVEVKISPQNEIGAKGSQGSLNLLLPHGLKAKIDDGKLLIIEDEKVSVKSEIYGLYRSLAKNIIEGVDKGFHKELSLIGVGFRAAIKGNKLDLQVGFSHPTELEIPQGLQIKVNKSVEIIISGMDKQLVGQFAALVRSKKPPEPYKGKGIRYKDEYVRKKAGKAAKSAGA